MVTTSTLMENLRQEGVSPDLLLAVNEYRTTHPLTEALAPRVPQSAFTYYGKDVWEQALEQEARHKLTYVWVKGHAGHPENERCDQLAVAQSQAHGGRQGR